MSVPKENIWQELRAECLDAIPSTSKVSIRAPMSLSAWQARGSYSVHSCTKTKFTLEASSAEIGSALLTDAEYLLDGAAEHQVMLWKQINSADWLSPAWLAVTTYYWAFYLLLALTRLTGHTAWFLTRDIVRNLRVLAPHATRVPGAGCFKLQCGTQQSVTVRELLLTKTDGRIHEVLWRMWFQNCASKVKRLSPGASDSLEERLYTAISASGRMLGEDWPSMFRNAVNYRNGFAYTAVRRERVLGSFGFLKTPLTYDVEMLVEKLEQSVTSLGYQPTILTSPNKVLELLIWITFVLHLIVTELHVELLDRQRLDARWSESRLRFLRSNGMECDDGFWPM